MPTLQQDLEAQATFNFPCNRSTGLFVAHRRYYKKALEYLKTASEARPDDRKTLHAQGLCKIKLGAWKDAIEDAQKYLDIPVQPEEVNPHVKGFYTKGLALYGMGEFEQALVQFHKGLALRTNPADFQEYVTVGRETIEDSIGRNVDKPLLEHYEEIKRIVELQQAEKEKDQTFLISNSKRCEDQPVIEVRLSKRTYWREKHEGDLMKRRYLGRLADDLKYLESIEDSHCLTQFVNTGGCKQVLDIIKAAELVLQNTKENLRTRQPYYSVKYQIERREALQKQKKARFTEKSVMNYDKAYRFLQTLRSMKTQRQVREFLVNAYRAKMFLDSTSERLLPKKQEYLDTLCNLTASVYLESHYLPPNISRQEHMRLMHIFFGLPVTGSRAYDSEFKRNILPPLDYRKIHKTCRTTIHLVENKLEKTTVLYTMARSIFDSGGSIEQCRIIAKQAEETAIEINHLIWLISICILQSRIEMRSGNKIDAKESMILANKYAKAYKNENLVYFTDLAVEIIETSNFEEPGVEEREQTILDIAEAAGFQKNIVDIFRHMAALPPSKRMSLMPGRKVSVSKKSRRTSY